MEPVVDEFVSIPTVVELEEPTDAPESPRVRDDGKIECVDCGRYFTQKADGTVRSHKCEPGVETATAVARVKPRAVKRRGKKAAPVEVRRWGVALGATAAESVSANIVARTIPCKSSDVPSQLPDPDAMIGPFLDYVWPQLPAKAQNVIGAVVEQEDLITAAFLWYEWWKKLDTWAEEHKTTEPDKGADNEQTDRLTARQEYLPFGGIEGFIPPSA